MPVDASEQMVEQGVVVAVHRLSLALARHFPDLLLSEGSVVDKIAQMVEYLNQRTPNPDATATKPSGPEPTGLPLPPQPVVTKTGAGQRQSWDAFLSNSDWPDRSVYATANRTGITFWRDKPQWVRVAGSSSYRWVGEFVEYRSFPGLSDLLEEGLDFASTVRKRPGGRRISVEEMP